MNSKVYYKGLSGNTFIAQLQQLTCLTCDGDLISKSDRTKLVAANLAQRVNGWNIITEDGIRYLERLGFIHS